MGKLAYLKDGTDKLKSKLDDADALAKSRQVDVEGIMAAQYANSAHKIQGALAKMVEESKTSQSGIFLDVIKSLNEVLRSQQTLLNDLSRLSTDSDSRKNDVIKEIGKVSNRVEVDSIASQIKGIEAQIAKLPTEFPLPKDVDLSGLSDEVKSIKSAIENIKMPEFEMPETVDVTPQLKEMEERMSNRVYEFDVVRYPSSGMIDKIVVTEGKV